MEKKKKFSQALSDISKGFRESSGTGSISKGFKKLTDSILERKKKKKTEQEG